MRIGIMTMQKQALIPPGMSRIEEAVAYVTQFNHADLARKLFDLGFDPIEVGGDMPLFLPHTLGPAAVEGLARLKQERGVSYTVHLPLWSVEPCTPLAPVREGSVRALVDVVRATLPLDPEVYVVHATGVLAVEFLRMDLPERAKAFIMRQFQRCAQSSLRAILDQTGIPSRQLAVETVEFPLDLTLELAEALDLSVCLDTGHVLAGFSGPVGLFEALELCLPRLGEIHLHDAPWQGSEGIIRYGQDHRPLGTGDLDLPRLLDRLGEMGFAGPLILELTAPEALASLDVIRSLRPEALRPSA